MDPLEEAIASLEEALCTHVRSNDLIGRSSMILIHSGRSGA
jgi:hypothetical protein